MPGLGATPLTPDSMLEHTCITPGQTKNSVFSQSQNTRMRHDVNIERGVQGGHAPTQVNIERDEHESTSMARTLFFSQTPDRIHHIVSS